MRLESWEYLCFWTIYNAVFGYALEISVILLCLAPELDSKYERLYAYIQNNIMKKRPSIGFVLDLLCPNIEQRIERRKYFLKSSPLFDLKILEMTDPQDNEPYLLSKQAKN